MRLGAVMAEVADRLGAVSGLRPTAFVPHNIQPPGAGMWPTMVSYDQTKGRGLDRIEFDLWVAVGRVEDRASWERLAGFADGSGATSVKQVLESHNGQWTTFNTARVRDCDFGELTVAGTAYLAGMFSLEIHGKGVM